MTDFRDNNDDGRLDNLIGLMAEHNMIIGQSSQLHMMGGFYAQETIEVNKQTVIMGTIVGNYFDMGNQVPDIYQVPMLANSWEESQRMIGSDPVWALTRLAFREFGI